MGAVFALFLQQCAFVGHDSAHNGITHHRNVDIMIGMVVGPLLTGISTAWWKRSHNAHHVVTNSVSHDPDIQHIPFFAVTADLFAVTADSFCNTSDVRGDDGAGSRFRE